MGKLSTHVILIGDIERPVPVQTIVLLEDAKLPGESDDDALNRVAKEKGGVVVENTPATFWPPRRFRSAWRFNRKTKKIEVDMTAVKSFLIDQSRRRRNIKLTELDVPFMRALEDGDQTKLQEVKAKKQILRDLPVALNERIDAILAATNKSVVKKLEELDQFKIPELEE